MSLFKNLFKPSYRFWLKFAHFIGKVNTALLLIVFYVILLGFSKLVASLAQRDLLDRRWKDRSSYWRLRENFHVVREAFLKPY